MSAPPEKYQAVEALPQGPVTGTMGNVAQPQQIRAAIEQFSLQDYAAHYFSEVKERGRFFRRKRVEMDKLMAYSPEPYVLLRHGNRQAQREAEALAKSVLAFMGDRFTAVDQNPDRLGADLIVSVQRSPELRDELYCQLIRQTSRNPSPRSALMGWRLFAVASGFVPPTRNLEPFLTDYFGLNCESPVADPDDPSMTVGGYAKYCQRTLRRLVKTTHGQDKRVPTPELFKRISHSAYKAVHEIFGSTPEGIMEWQSQLRPNPLPLAFTTLLELFVAADGPSTEGVFRISSSCDSEASLRALLETEQQISRSQFGPHVVANVLKQFFREMDTPFIPELTQAALIAAGDKPHALCSILSSGLSPLRQDMLALLFNLLRRVSSPENCPKTLMSVANLSIVWAPNLFRSENEDPKFRLERAVKEPKILALLLEHWQVGS